MTTRTITFDDEQWQVVPRELTGNMIDTINGHIDADSDAVALWRDTLIDAPEPPAQEPTEIDNAIAAGDGTLHGAIDYWQERALKAEAKLAAQEPMTDEEIDAVTGSARDALLDHLYEYGTTSEGAQRLVRMLARAALAKLENTK